MKKEAFEYLVYLSKKMHGRVGELSKNIGGGDGYDEFLFRDIETISDEVMDVLKNLVVDVIF